MITNVSETQKKKKKKIHVESATRVSDFSDGLQDIPL